MSDKRLSGKVALITGSSRGLGRAIAERLAELGAAIAIHDINPRACAEFGEAKDIGDVAQQIGRHGSKTAFVCGDIGNEDQVREMVAGAERQLGPIDILVNVAGGDIAAKGGKPNPNDALGVKLEDVRAILDRNLIGTMLVCKYAVPGMQQRRRGSVINIASAQAHRAFTAGVSYAVAKAAIVHYTSCLALQVRPDNVRVNAVSPGPTVTARFLATRPVDPKHMEETPSLERFAQPREIADVIAFLASDESRYVSGQTIQADAGWLLAPANVTPSQK